MNSELRSRVQSLRRALIKQEVIETVFVGKNDGSSSQLIKAVSGTEKHGNCRISCLDVIEG